MLSAVLTFLAAIIAAAALGILRAATGRALDGLAAARPKPVGHWQPKSGQPPAIRRQPK